MWGACATLTISVLLFSGGFFLTRVELSQHSSCNEPWSGPPSFAPTPPGCWLPARYEKVPTSFCFAPSQVVDDLTCSYLMIADSCATCGCIAVRFCGAEEARRGQGGFCKPHASRARAFGAKRWHSRSFSVHRRPSDRHISATERTDDGLHAHFLRR
jgi:hypothetical protein